jgi:putative transposase
MTAMMPQMTAKEIADRLGVARFTVSRWVKEENWHSITELVNGIPVNKYLVSLLPEERKRALMTKSENLPAIAENNLPAAVITDELPDYKTLKGWQKKIMNARLALFREFQRIEADVGTNQAIDKFITTVRHGQLPQRLQTLVSVANARSGSCQGNRTISKSTIFRWKEMDRQGLTAFAPKAVGKMEVPAWAPYFIKCFSLPQKPTIPEAIEEMAKILPPEIQMPSYWQVQRFHKKRSRLDRQRGRKTGSELQGHRAYRIRDTSEYMPFDVGVCDGHSFKARVAHPVHGRPFHPEVCAVIDAATKVCMGWSAGLAESSQTVADAVRHAATVCEAKTYGGVFGILYTDGGSGNAAKVNTDEFIGLFPRLGTIWEKGIPGNAQGHGLVEILNKSLWIRAAKQLATFTGKQMDKLTARKMYLLVNKDIKEKGHSELLPTWPQFLENCRQAVEDYNRRPHSSLPKITDQGTGRRRHMCPLEKLAWHISHGWQPESVQFDQNTIDTLFMPRAEATVVRSTVTLWKNIYYDKMLEHYDGERVQIAYDIHDASVVRIYDDEDRLICKAEFEKNKSSYFPMPLVEQAREQRAKRRAQLKQEQLAEIEAERNGLIDIAPAPERKIINMRNAAQIKVDRAALQKEMAHEPEREIPIDDKGKYKFWCELDRELSRGVTLTGKELRFYEAYRMTTSFRAFRMVAEDLGEAMQ